MSILGFIARTVRKMFPRQTITRFYDVQPAMSAAFAAEVVKWQDMYMGGAPWVDGEDVVSLRLEQGTVREFADIVLNEMTAQVSNKELDRLFRRAVRDINRELQRGLATGAMVIKPLGTGSDTVQYIPQTGFIPLRYDADHRLTDVIFPEVVKLGDSDYRIRMERHTLDERGLTISNRAFSSSAADMLEREIPLGSLSKWEGLLPEVFYPGMTRQAFGYFVTPVDNTFDLSEPGMSVFAAAEHIYRRADIQFGRLDWEYDSAERAIHADEQALKITEQNGHELPKKRLYRGLNLMGRDGELFKEYSPQLRDDSYRSGLNAYKREIEFVVGLSYGDLSDPSNVDKTATEVIAAKQRKYNRVTAIQDNLRDCLEDLVYALAFYRGMATSGYEFSCTFKDSIKSDEEAERENDRKDVSMGIMRPEEYRAKWYGESIDTALHNLPETAQVLD